MNAHLTFHHFGLAVSFYNVVGLGLVEILE
jgi:hypothetical protein